MEEMSLLRSAHLVRHLQRQGVSINCSVTSSRNISGLPPGVAPLFDYASNCNITQGVQSSIEAIHGLGLPWASTIVVSGIVLRLATAPAHIYAEKLFAKRLHASNFFTHGILKKLGQHFNLEIVPNKGNTKLELKTDNEKIHKECDRLITEKVSEYLHEHRLQASRIQNLKMLTVPIWIFSSFAIRNIISSDFHPNIPGALWLNDMLLPDPYFILPVAVGVFGFLNLYAQKFIYPVRMSNFRTKSYDYLLAFFTLFAVRIMMDLPACISLYWLTVSTTGMAQAMILRHPKVKSLLGIHRLPTDSRTPFRDLILLRPHDIQMWLNGSEPTASTYAVRLYRPVVYHATTQGSVRRIEYFTKYMNKDEFQQCIGPDHQGRNSSFVYAARNGKTEVVKYMVDRGADPNTTGEVNFDGEQISAAPALWAASAAGHMDIVKYLVEVGGADVNAATSSNSTPLRGACFDGHLEIVAFLIENGADIEKANKHGHTPLMIAAFRKHAAIVEYLLHKSADVKRKSVRGNTALHDAAEVGHTTIAKMLIRYGALNLKDEYGTTPFMCAAYLGQHTLFPDLTPMASPSELRDCYKLLGAHFLDRMHDIQEAYRCWERSVIIDMELRREGIEDDFTLPDSSTIVYGGASEICTYEELLAVRDDHERMKIQALIMRERILGGHHSETIYALRYRGAIYCDMGQFEQCMDVWMHALNLQQFHLCPLHPGIAATFGTFLDTFIYATNELFINSKNTSAELRNAVFRSVMLVLDRVVFEFERYARKEQKIDFGDVFVFVDGPKTLNQELKELMIIGLHILNLVFRLEPSTNLQTQIAAKCKDVTTCTGGRDCCPRYNPKFVERNIEGVEPFEIHQFKQSYQQPIYCINMENIVRSFVKIGACLKLNILHLLFVPHVTRVDEVQFPSLALMNVLLKADAATNRTDENGNTPLHCLMKCNLPRITLAQALLAHGALVHARNKANETCFELIQCRRPNWNLGGPMTLLGMAANAVRRQQLQYDGTVPKHLHKFLDLH